MFTTFLGSSACGESGPDFNTSLITEEFEKSMLQLRYTAYQIIGPTLIVMGIIGNILNLVVLTRPFLNECTRIYLRALAIADMHVLIFEIPMLVRLNEIEGSSLFVAVYHAHLELLLVTTFLAFNVYIVLCLTIDRYISVCVPIMFNTVHTKQKAKIFLIICFVVAVVITLPIFMLKTICYIESPNDCDKWSTQENIIVTHTIYWKTYIVVSEILIRIAPAIVLAVLNTLIIRKFRTVTEKRNEFRNSTQQYEQTNSSTSGTLGNCCLRNKKYQEEKRLIVLLQAVMVLFFLTMIPSSCLSLVYSESEDFNLTYQIFRAVANLLEIANSSLNFCAYFLCSREFRRGLLSIFTGCCRNSLQNNDAPKDDCVAEGVKGISIQSLSDHSVNKLCT